ncbi:hypothetical protein LIA77_07791 [Sarocladium implicatum]|nr:hypothetical protein LIA77_07791 [Sarocladium implicatum]
MTTVLGFSIPLLRFLACSFAKFVSKVVPFQPWLRVSEHLPVVDLSFCSFEPLIVPKVGSTSGYPIGLVWLKYPTKNALYWHSAKDCPMAPDHIQHSTRSTRAFLFILYHSRARLQHRSIVRDSHSFKFRRSYRYYTQFHVPPGPMDLRGNTTVSNGVAPSPARRPRYVRIRCAL